MSAIALPKILLKIAKRFAARIDQPKYPTVREAMIELHTDWQELMAKVKGRNDHESISNAALNMSVTLVKLVNDLGVGIGQFDVGLPADDLIRGTEIAQSPCCSKNSTLVGVISTGKQVKWRMLCTCGKEWLL